MKPKTTSRQPDTFHDLAKHIVTAKSQERFERAIGLLFHPPQPLQTPLMSEPKAKDQRVPPTRAKKPRKQPRRVDDITVDFEANNTDLKLALRLWNAARRGSRMPTPAEMATDGIVDSLPMGQLYSVIDGGAACRVKTLSSRFLESLETNPIGKTFDSSTKCRLARRVLIGIAETAYRRRPVVVRTDATPAKGVGMTQSETIYLPLSSDGKLVDAVVAATAIGDATFDWSYK